MHDVGHGLYLSRVRDENGRRKKCHQAQSSLRHWFSARKRLIFAQQNQGEKIDQHAVHDVDEDVHQVISLDVVATSKVVEREADVGDGTPADVAFESSRVKSFEVDCRQSDRRVVADIGVVVEHEGDGKAVQVDDEAEDVENNDGEQVNLVGFSGEFHGS